MTTPNQPPTAGEQGSPPEPWMVKAAQEIVDVVCFPGTGFGASQESVKAATIIARHAPARSQSGEGVELELKGMHILAEQDRARIASLESEAKDLRHMLDRTAEEAFGLDDTIGLEPYDEYFIRQVAKLRAAARPADSSVEQGPALKCNCCGKLISDPSPGCEEKAHPEQGAARDGLVERLKDVETQLLDDSLRLAGGARQQAYYRALAQHVTDAIALLSQPAVAQTEAGSIYDMTARESKDSARLDWVEANDADLHRAANGWQLFTEDYETTHEPTVRAVVDEAMRHKPGI